MPASNGVLGPDLQRRAEAQNNSCAGLDWEIEDFLPEDLIRGFCDANPGELIREQKMAGRIHREFTRVGKGLLQGYVAEEALVEDMSIMQPHVATTAPVVGLAITAGSVVPGSDTGASYESELVDATLYAVEVAKQFTWNRIAFYDADEYSKLVGMYGDMSILQTVPGR